jgi:hypothetical protein
MVNGKEEIENLLTKALVTPESEYRKRDIPNHENHNNPIFCRLEIGIPKFYVG